MSIGSKPQDDDPIIELVYDSLGNKQFVATQLLSVFFDDLVAAVNPASSAATQTQRIYEEQDGALNRLTIKLHKNITESKSTAALLSEKDAEISRQAVQIRELLKQLSNYANQIDELETSLSSLQAEQARMAAILKKVENLCQ